MLGGGLGRAVGASQKVRSALSDSRPNILLILADDMGFSDAGTRPHFLFARTHHADRCFAQRCL